MSRTNKLHFIEAMLNWFASPSMGRELDVKFLSDAYDDITAPAWVSVEEELPPLHYEGANSTDFVLIYDGGDVLIAYYDFKEKKWYNEQYGALIIPATHWMLLPTPPAEKGGQDETD